MKIVIAPDSFKGSLSAVRAAEAMAIGWLTADPHATLVKIPLADGGEGTVSALIAALGGRYGTVAVQDPLSRPISAQIGLLRSNTAVLEMAAASGLPRLRPAERNPFKTSTYGTGQLILAALNHGALEIILGVGGSATVDGGAGALQALGARLLDADGNDIPPGNEGLARLARIDLSTVDARLRTTRMRVASDVTNLLTGPTGAAAVFGPQKGASSSDIPQLERNLAHFAAILDRDAGTHVASLVGGGAAGGLTAGLSALGATIESGIALVLEATAFASQLADADLILTGEGKIDGQTIQGKVISGVLSQARTAQVPVVALAGAVEAEALAPLYAAGLSAAFSIMPRPVAARIAYAQASPFLAHATASVARLWCAAATGSRLEATAVQQYHAERGPEESE